MKEETEKDKDALEMRWPNKETNMEANMETKMDANMIDNIETNYKNINRETGAILDRIAIQVEELVKAIKKNLHRNSQATQRMMTYGSVKT